MCVNHVFTGGSDRGFHDCPKRLEIALRCISQASMREEDKESIRSFLRHLEEKGMSLGRQAKYAFTFKVLDEALHEITGRSLSEAGWGDYDALMARFNRQPYTPHTRSDHKDILRRFVKWLKTGSSDKDTPYPLRLLGLRLG